MDHARRMGQGHPTWLLLKFSIPATLGTLMNLAYNLVDRIFVGQAVGEAGLAALSVSFPIMLVLMAFGMMFGYGANTLISTSLGESNKRHAEEVLGQGLLLFGLLAVAFMFFGFAFLEPLLRLFGASDTVLPYAQQYMMIIISGILFHEVSFGVNSFIRGEGNPGAAMVTMVIGAGGNIVLDWLFVWTFGWGMQGAALATVIAQLLATVWVLSYYVSGRGALRIRWEFIRWNASLSGRIVALGFPYFFVQFAQCAMLGVMNNQLRTYGGDTAIAVGAVLFTVAMVVFMPLIGLSQGAQPLIGYNYGARRYDRVARLFALAMLTATAICITCFTFIQLFPDMLIAPFSGDNAAVLTVGSQAIRKFMMMLPGVGIVFIASNYFLATRRPVVSFLLSMMRQVLLLIPLMVFLPQFWALDGVWYAMPISDFGAFLLSSTLAVYEMIRLKRLGATALNGAEPDLDVMLADAGLLGDTTT